MSVVPWFLHVEEVVLHHHHRQGYTLLRVQLWCILGAGISCTRLDILDHRWCLISVGFTKGRKEKKTKCQSSVVQALAVAVLPAHNTGTVRGVCKTGGGVQSPPIHTHKFQKKKGKTIKSRKSTKMTTLQFTNGSKLMSFWVNTFHPNFS